MSEDQGTFEATRQRQIRLGLELTPLERLQWLEARRAELAHLRALMPRDREEPGTGKSSHGDDRG